MHNNIDNPVRVYVDLLKCQLYFPYFLQTTLKQQWPDSCILSLTYRNFTSRKNRTLNVVITRIVLILFFRILWDLFYVTSKFYVVITYIWRCMRRRCMRAQSVRLQQTEALVWLFYYVYMLVYCFCLS